MSVFKIAWRSIQHRGLGSLLTMVTMGLGVMMVVAVLTIHGVVSQSFRSNSSFGFNVLLGSRGGSMQLTMNTVYYLSRPLEPIPFEYYLAFRDADSRSRYIKQSVAAHVRDAQEQSLTICRQLLGGSCGFDLESQWTSEQVSSSIESLVNDQMANGKPGAFADYASMVIPMALGDGWSRELGAGLPTFRVVGTTSEFFSQMVLDVDTNRKFKFAQGRNFHDYDEKNGFFECVIGSHVAKAENLKIGDIINPIHGDPNSQQAHIHEQGFELVGILEPTASPNDRAIFVNLEGFYLMEDHAKPIHEGQPTEPSDDDKQEIDEFDARSSENASEWTQAAFVQDDRKSTDSNERVFPFPDLLDREPLPIEQREVTALLILTNPEGDPFGAISFHLTGLINNGGFLEPTLGWSNFRPVRAQVAPMAVNPVVEVTNLFANIVDPIQWVLLGLTVMICIVSGISILVGIYNSMSQRRHEIAVMRALGAGRNKVMLIMLCESILLSLGGGMLGWIAGHSLNAGLSSTIEAKTGVVIGFFDFAPPTRFLEYVIPGISKWGSSFVQYLVVSPELLLVPGLILLAIIVGVYPAISAYRTDVAKSLGV